MSVPRWQGRKYRIVFNHFGVDFNEVAKETGISVIRVNNLLYNRGVMPTSCEAEKIAAFADSVLASHNAAIVSDLREPTEHRIVYCNVSTGCTQLSTR